MTAGPAVFAPAVIVSPRERRRCAGGRVASEQNSRINR